MSALMTTPPPHDTIQYAIDQNDDLKDLRMICEKETNVKFGKRRLDII